MVGGAFDQRETEQVFSYAVRSGDAPLAERPDVLVFATGPLAEDTIVTGVMEVELWISSDRPDTDFTAKLVDVYPPSADYPEGFAMNITDGIFRARFREGWDEEVFMAPGEVYRIQIEPFATSNLFAKGHRLRVDISSSNYPHFDMNPNTDAPLGHADAFEVATNRVWCCAAYPSRITLPIAGH
jgi:putative CocE/NonD family hydrolase